ncbi:pre-mRNA-splicing factor syf1 homolog [Leptinotarsa decemlineata]|uniref:pre-mRNA-splicing factor syf1 homolog n=1 Tax=Leptinotarsa decemlineata TaxID=7539 RepID=UPI003D30A603
MVQQSEHIEIKFGDDDLPYEEEILRNPYSVKHWLRYVEHKKVAPKGVNIVYERALRQMPGSYKVCLSSTSRYWKLCPENAEEYVDFLTEIGRLDEAAQVLAKIVNDENVASQKGKSKHQLWNELCELISKNPDMIRSLNVDAIIRGGLRRYTDQLGHLWNSLANYYGRSGLFERARDIYEKAIQTVTTVRDFTQVFYSYAQFEELSLSKKMKEVANQANPTEDDDTDLEMRLSRFENLLKML